MLSTQFIGSLGTTSLFGQFQRLLKKLYLKLRLANHIHFSPSSSSSFMEAWLWRALLYLQALLGSLRLQSGMVQLCRWQVGEELCNRALHVLRAGIGKM